MSEPRIALEGAREKPLPFSGETALDAPSLGGDPLVSIGPARMEGVLTWVDPDYLLDGQVSFSGELICSRCVTPDRFSESVPVHLRLRRAVSGEGPREETPDELRIDPDELDVVFYDEPILPFREIVREQVLMAIPMKPLCREDCKGLCPTCGADENAGECGCEKAAADPRWEVLKSLK